jgi:hypothetical protein
MSSNSIIKAKILRQYPQMNAIVSNILVAIKTFDSGTAETIDSLFSAFIDDAKEQHDEDSWGNKYDRGVTLLTCHFISEAQPKSVNSGLIVKEKTGSESETEYLRPSLNNFGKYSTTKYGRAWEALKDTVTSDDIGGFHV